MLKKGYPVQDVIEAAKNAGKEIIKYGRMKEETLKAVSRELLPLETYVEILNKSFKKVLDRLKS